jgi:hypothetical protein
MADVLKQLLPGIKTQAQLTAFMIAFDSFRVLCEALLEGDKDQEEVGKELLDKALEALRTSSELSAKFAELPEDQKCTSAANSFVSPPVQFLEYDVQKRLLSELSRITTKEELNTWYVSTKGDRDRVVSQSLRNVLMDSIRSKKDQLK